LPTLKKIEVFIATRKRHICFCPDTQTNPSQKQKSRFIQRTPNHNQIQFIYLHR